MIRDYDYKYNKEPIYYCKECGGLHILRDEVGDYCYDCPAGARIGKTTIEVWEDWYKETFNKDPLE